MRSLRSFTLIFTALTIGCAASMTTPAASDAIAGSDETSRNSAIRQRISFFEHRVAADPEDIVALNRLGNLYLALMRRTGDHSLIPKAEAAAEASLRSVPAIQNAGGLALLASARAASHQFESARDLLSELISLHGEKTEYLASLADAYTELGDYSRAAETFERLAARQPDIGTLTRLARWDSLNGRTEGAAQRLHAALALAKAEAPPDPDVVSWILWQLGENAFARGDFITAERRYREGLEVRPQSVALLHSLGRLLAGGSQLEEAIAFYRRAVEIDPIPYIVAALADAYEISGDSSLASTTLNGVPSQDPLDSRHVVLIWADHDIHQSKALEMALADWAQRKDIYTADALAWAALKAGQIEEAQARSADALRLGTRDAKLLYHAGMIARASGHRDEASELLRSALELNPRFDAKQSRIARATLAELSGSDSR